MKYKVTITDEKGNERSYNLTRSSSGEPENLNDFIFKALEISEEKRKLPFLTRCPNGMEAHPTIKMKFENNGSPLSGEKLEAMVVSWQD